MGQRPDSYLWRWVATGLALLTLNAWLLAGGTIGTAVTAVLVFDAAALTLGVTAFGPPWQAAPDHGQLAKWALSLAHDVGTREAAEQQRFLGETGQGRPADLSFRQPELTHWRTDGGGRHGSLREIGAFYSKLRLGRMMILGEAGSGKTVLANQLLLDLIGMLESADRPLQKFVVPIRINLSSVELGRDYQRVGAEELSLRFRAWITRYLLQVYGIRPRIGRALLYEGWILPILDGLDEMDSEIGMPTRTSAIVRALNYPAGAKLIPVVLTCRTDWYDQLIASSSVSGFESVLQDVTVVSVQRLNIRQVISYLTYRFPDPEDTSRIEHRWEGISRDISTNHNGTLAKALRSPLQLFLAIMAYYPATTNPTELIGLNAEQLNLYLFGQLVPSAIRTYGPRRERSYTPINVARWLTTMANDLHTRTIQESKIVSNIELDRLWMTAGNRLPRYLAALVLALTMATLLTLDVRPQEIDLWAMGGFVSFTAKERLIAVLYVLWRSSRLGVRLRRIEVPRLGTSWGRRRVGLGLALALACLAAGWSVGILIWSPRLSYLRSGILGSLTVGFALAVPAGISAGLLRKPSVIRYFRQLVRQGVTADLIVVFAAGLAFGFVFVITYLPYNLALLLHMSFWTGSLLEFYLHFFISGAVLGLAFGIAIRADSPWCRYAVATIILAVRRKLPWRPARFMDWAHIAGLLRISGISAQFRHSNVQTYFTLD